MKVNYTNLAISLVLIFVSAALIAAAHIENLAVNFLAGVLIGFAFPVIERKE